VAVDGRSAALFCLKDGSVVVASDRETKMSGIWIVLHISLWLAVMLLFVAVFTLARQVGLLHTRLSPSGARMTNAGPELGTEAPEVAALDLSDRAVNIGVESDKHWLLVFVSSSCSTCAGLVPALHSIRRSEKGWLNIVLVGVHGSKAENNSFRDRHNLKSIPYIVSESIGHAYGVTSPPYAIILDPRRIVLAKGIVNHMDHMESLLNAAQSKQPSMETWSGLRSKPSEDLVLSN
jgi:methylamine dehydrogenase accessory protein MauD